MQVRMCAMCVGSGGLGQALRAATADGTSIRATPGVRRGCAVARRVDISARCTYHAKELLGETPTGAAGMAGPPQEAGAEELNQLGRIVLDIPIRLWQ